MCDPARVPISWRLPQGSEYFAACPKTDHPDGCVHATSDLRVPSPVIVANIKAPPTPGGVQARMRYAAMTLPGTDLDWELGSTACRPTPRWTTEPSAIASLMPSQHNGCEHSAPPVWRGITPRLGCINCFCGSRKLTTWAYKFVIFEVSGKLARHFWLDPSTPMEAEDRLPDRFGPDPAAAAE